MGPTITTTLLTKRRRRRIHFSKGCMGYGYRLWSYGDFGHYKSSLWWFLCHVNIDLSK